jgi:methylmalonyl-CoA mutase
MSFEKIDTATWKAKIEADLKGKPFEKLIWSSPELLQVQPFYTQALKTEASPRKEARWTILEPVAGEAHEWNHKALHGLTGGAEAILLDADRQYLPLEIMSKDILIDIAPILLRNYPSSKIDASFWQQYQNSACHLGIDPISDIISGTAEEYNFKDLEYFLGLQRDLGATWGVLAVQGSIFKNSGGSIVDEIAFTLSSLQEHLHKITEGGFQVNQIREIILYNAVGNNFFFEIAKLRALRRLANIILEQYGGGKLSVSSESDGIHSSILDVQTNILRLSTIAMSAALGGSDYLALHPYDTTASSARISRNIQHLLMEESYLDKNLDPVAGSYYIETITHELEEKAWNLFLEIEKQGGFVNALLSGFVQSRITSHLSRLQDDIAQRKSILLGVNQFPNLLDEPVVRKANTSAQSALLRPVFLADPFEQLRIKMHDFQAKGHAKPKAFLFQFGTPAMRKARATFAFNFLASAGISSIENAKPDDLSASLLELQELKPDIVVFCSDNESWTSILPEILAATPPEPIKIMAGRNDLSGFDFTIFEGCEVLDILQKICQQLRIE